MLFQWLSDVQCPVLAPDTASVNSFCIILVLVPASALVPETASVNIPLEVGKGSVV